MKKKFVVEVLFSAMNEMSLYERLRNAVFAWHQTEPKVRGVTVTAMRAPSNSKESRPTVRPKRAVQQRKQYICGYYPSLCNYQCDHSKKYCGYTKRCNRKRPAVA